MPITRSSARPPVAAPAANTRSAAAASASTRAPRAPTATRTRKKKTQTTPPPRKKKTQTTPPPRQKPQAFPGNVVPEDEGAFPAHDEPEKRDQSEQEGDKNNTLPGLNKPEDYDGPGDEDPKKGDDKPDDDDETIDSNAGASNGSQMRFASPLPHSSPPPLSSPRHDEQEDDEEVHFRLQPRRQSPRSATVPRPETGDVSDDLFSLAHRQRSRAASVSSDRIWNFVYDDERGDATKGNEGGLDDDGEQGVYGFSDFDVLDYKEPDDMGETFVDRRPMYTLRRSRSNSPGSSSYLLRGRSPRSITVSPISPGATLRSRLHSRSLTPTRTNTNPRGRSPTRRSGDALSHNLPLPPARGPPPPLPPAHTRPSLAPLHPHTRNGGRALPCLPEHSPLVSRDLSSGDSGDEYGLAQDAKQKLMAAREARGYPPAPPSDAEDEEDLQVYMAEVAANGFRDDDVAKQSKTRKAKATTAAGAGAGVGASKGKGKAVMTAPSADPNPQEVVEEDLMERGYTPGPIPRQILDDLYTLEEEYDTKVAALAARCNKDPATLRRATTPHELRNASAWNMYMSHHAVHHPKKPGVSATQFNTEARKAFEALLPGLSKAEMGKTSLVLERLPWLLNWWKDLNANHVENLRAKGQYRAQAKKAAEPLIQMAKQLSTTWGLHIFAVAVDPRGGDSFAFAGSREMEQVRIADGSSITAFMGDLETKIRVLQMVERGEDASRLYVPRPAKPSNQVAKKGKRDSYRSRFAAIMGDRLTEICFKTGLMSAEQVKTATMVWNEKFLDLAFRGKFRLVDYPVVLENIGQIVGLEQFNTKLPNVREYDAFMPALERAAKAGTAEDPEGDHVIRIVPWEPNERDQLLEDQEDIPLVVSTDGRALRMVRHSPMYGAAVVDASQRRAQRRAEKKRAEAVAPPPRPPSPPAGASSHIPTPAPRSRVPPAPPAQPKHREDPVRSRNGVKTQIPLRTSRSQLAPAPWAGPPQQGNTIAGPSRPRHDDDATGREAALARRLQLSPGLDKPLERPAKRRRRGDNNDLGPPSRKRKRSPSPAVAEHPLIAIRLGTDKGRSPTFYAWKFQPAPHPRFRDSYTFYFNIEEQKWQQVPDGMEPVLASTKDREVALKWKRELGLEDRE